MGLALGRCGRDGGPRPGTSRAEARVAVRCRRRARRERIDRMTRRRAATGADGRGMYHVCSNLNAGCTAGIHRIFRDF